jgi:hypothetical protein
MSIHLTPAPLIHSQCHFRSKASRLRKLSGASTSQFPRSQAPLSDLASLSTRGADILVCLFGYRRPHTPLTSHNAPRASSLRPRRQVGEAESDVRRATTIAAFRRLPFRWERVGVRGTSGPASLQHKLGVIRYRVFSRFQFNGRGDFSLRFHAPRSTILSDVVGETIVRPRA